MLAHQNTYCLVSILIFISNKHIKIKITEEWCSANKDLKYLHIIPNRFEAINMITQKFVTTKSYTAIQRVNCQLNCPRVNH